MAKLRPIKPGRRFGKLTVLSAAVEGPMRLRKWNCLCTCGREIVAWEKCLRYHGKRSCGHIARNKARRQGRARARHHGASGRRLPEYRIWSTIIQSCTNPNQSGYAGVGAKGITFDPRWRDFKTFLADVGRRPSLSYALMRIEKTGNFEPSNVEWRSRTLPKRGGGREPALITIDGVPRSLRQWARLQRLGERTIRERRARGWSDRDAIMTPAGGRATMLAALGRQGLPADPSRRPSP